MTIQTIPPMLEDALHRAGPNSEPASNSFVGLNLAGHRQ